MRSFSDGILGGSRFGMVRSYKWVDRKAFPSFGLRNLILAVVILVSDFISSLYEYEVMQE